MTSGGENVVWSWDAGSGVLTGATEHSNEVVATVTLGSVASAGGSHSASYTVKLLAALDHEQGQQENILDLEFGFSVSDGVNQPQTASFVVKVEDDMPSAIDSVQSVGVPSVNTNLMIALDLSGSMKDPSGVNGLSRLELSLQSLERLVKKYEELGDVRVRIVTFAAAAEKHGDVWMTAEEAHNYLTSLKNHYPDGYTNYDAALSVMQDAFNDDGALSNAQNVSYFVSDGAPTASDGDTETLANTDPKTDDDNPDHGIQGKEEETWTNFLNTNHINSIAFGIGGDVPVAKLNPIAHNGSNHNNGDTNAVIVTDLSRLEATLEGSVVIPPYSGNLLGSGGFGADGGHVQDITVKMDVNGVDTLVKFTYDADANQITNDAGLPIISGSQLDVTTTLPAKFSLNMTDGSYIHQSMSAATGAADDTFGFTLADNDGDTSSATLTMHIEAPVPIVGQSLGTNVLIMLDMSSSMSVCFNDTTRLEAAKSALADMLTKYQEVGEVKVQLATFNYDQQVLSSTWMTISEALIRLDDISDPDGGTSYDAALEGMKAAFNTDGKLLNAKNVSYCLSDGEPHPSYVIDAAEQVAWQQFVDTNNIKSHAVAIANDANALYLGPIAYDGEAGTELVPITPSTLAELSAELVGSVVAPGHMYTGTALADLIVSGLGDDFMIGNGGADRFSFNLDGFNASVVETDTIEDFNVAEGDKLDLSDFLTGENSSNLDNYLNFESQGGDTLVHINKDGDFGNSGQIDQTILLKGVDLMSGGLNDQQIINELLSNGSLIID
ncbi:MAG: hypothetical protein OFPII_09980 [Osedax symbiont Rs1]|nr:MAG: hypothetical protein OFPII_09980 [Osedax symbiont Rs1]